MKNLKKVRSRRTAVMAVLTALLMLVPALLTGCESADKLIERREKADEIGKKAEAYMLEKYNRTFNVKRCEEAEGEAYEGDYFITFKNNVHAFYDSEADYFSDDRQSSVINEDIYKEIWMPMMDDIGLMYDNVGNWSQVFNLTYEYTRGGELKQFSMYHDYYKGYPDLYVKNNKIFVVSQNLILVSKQTGGLDRVYDTLVELVRRNFKGQKKGDLRFYVISDELHAQREFDPEKVDETLDGCMALMQFGEENRFVRHKFVKADDGLYVMPYGSKGQFPEEGDVTLTPVSNSDAVSKKILDTMNSKKMNLMDKYITKKRSITFEQIYKLEMPSSYADEAENFTFAFSMRDSEDPIAEYASVNERERSFFAYNLNGDDYNAVCLCSAGSRSTSFTYHKGDEVYVWYGTQF